jgi:hypothetical protein
MRSRPFKEIFGVARTCFCILALSLVTRVRARFGSIRPCYENGLRRNRDLTGKVTTRFVIDVDGKTREANADEWQSNMPDAEVTKCVVQQIRGTVFPPPWAAS